MKVEIIKVYKSWVVLDGAGNIIAEVYDEYQYSIPSEVYEAIAKYFRVQT